MYQRSTSLNGTSANNVHLGESQNYLPSATRNGLATLHLSGDLHDVGFVLANSSNRRRQSYVRLLFQILDRSLICPKQSAFRDSHLTSLLLALQSNINSRYPLTGRLGHVVEALDDLRQLQRDTEAALEAQCQQTELERQQRQLMERSLQAESQLREEAEANIQIYNNLIQQLRSDQERSAASNAKVKSAIESLTSMLVEKTLSGDNAELALQILQSLSKEVNRT